MKSTLIPLILLVSVGCTRFDSLVGIDRHHKSNELPSINITGLWSGDNNHDGILDSEIDIEQSQAGVSGLFYYNSQQFAFTGSLVGNHISATVRGGHTCTSPARIDADLVSSILTVSLNSDGNIPCGVPLLNLTIPMTKG